MAIGLLDAEVRVVRDKSGGGDATDGVGQGHGVVIVREPQRAVLAPTVMLTGPWMVGSVYFETTPAVVMRPIEALYWFVNHSAPRSGPATMPLGCEMLGSVKFDTVPAVVMRPIELFLVREPQSPVWRRQ